MCISQLKFNNLAAKVRHLNNLLICLLLFLTEQMTANNIIGIRIPSVFVGHTTGQTLLSFFTPEVELIINDELPFNINTQLILPFSILIGLCFLIMVCSIDKLILNYYYIMIFLSFIDCLHDLQVHT